MMTSLDKTLIAAIMALVVLANTVAGHAVFPEGTEAYVTAAVTVLTPLLVYLVPNKPKG